MSLKASLRRDQRRFDEALELLSTVIGIYIAGNPATQDFHMAGRAFLLKAKVFEEQGDLEQALSLLREASPLIDPERDPRLALCLWHNHVDYLSKLGRSDEARALLPQVQKLAQTLGNALDLARLRWVEARIASGLGDTVEAERLYLHTRDEFASHGIAFDVAFVSLELAILYAKEKRYADIKELSRDIGSLLQAQGLHQEAIAAFFAAFERATISECVPRDVLQDLTKILGSVKRPRNSEALLGDLIA
jgi:tetratricopeptide (TPR) repeat protein